LLAIVQTVTAQGPIRAKSEAGKDVILYPDGTWKYVPVPSEIPSTLHNKPSSATKLFKPSRGNFGIWYDETKWRDKAGADPDEKLRFVFIGGDAYVMVLVEEIPIPLDSLKNAALVNARVAAPDAKIVKEEMRTVNGKPVLSMIIQGTVQQIPFTYYGYYYGGKDGAIQVVGFTGQNIFAKYEAEFTKLLDGLEIY
jgi:hypothetical protein